MVDQNEGRVCGVFSSEYLESGRAAAESLGAAAVVLPAASFEPPAAEAELPDVSTFDWVIFADALSVHYFNYLLQERGVDISVLESVRVCAADETTALRLRDLFVHADVVPWLPDAECAAAAIREFDPEKLAGSRMLLVDRAGTGPDLADLLTNEGAAVLEFAYRVSGSDDSARAKALLIGGGIDALIISSRLDMFALHILFPETDIRELLSGIDIFAASDDVYGYLSMIGIRCTLLPGSAGRNSSSADA